MKENQKVIAVVGPTASGKSDFAVKLAKEYNGEIISADSRQIYNGLDIGTGKITQEEMCDIPHHMLDIIDTNQNFSVAEYNRLALPILEDILVRGKTPIICGGTGQYIDSLIFKQSIPEVEPNLALRADLEQKTVDELYTLLQQKDKGRAKVIDRYNRVRIIRALEIIDSLGYVPEQITPTFRHATTIYIMQPSRELLREKITKRLEKRLNTGILEEAQDLISKNIPKNSLKKFGIEYVALAQYLSKEIDEETMKQEIITKSMQYAKRQDTWNKKYLSHATIVKVTQ